MHCVYVVKVYMHVVVGVLWASFVFLAHSLTHARVTFSETKFDERLQIRPLSDERVLAHFEFQAVAPETQGVLPALMRHMCGFPLEREYRYCGFRDHAQLKWKISSAVKWDVSQSKPFTRAEPSRALAERIRAGSISAWSHVTSCEVQGWWKCASLTRLVDN